MIWNQVKSMGRWVMSSTWIFIAVPSALVVFDVCYIAAHELAACKLADKNGVIGMVVAVPRYHVCFYMVPLREHDEKKQLGGFYTATGMNNDYMPIDQFLNQDASLNIRRSWPCIQQYLHRTAARHFSPPHGLEL